MNKDFFSKPETVSIFSNILSSLEDAIIISDSETRILYANPSFKKLYGYNYKDIENQPVGRILKSGIQDVKFYQKLWKSLNVKGYWKGEIVNKAKNGEFLYVEETIIALKNEKGEPVNYVSACKDVSKLRSIETELVTSNLRFDLVFWNSLNGKALVSTKGQFIKVNPTLCSMLGYTEDELMSKTFLCITHPEDVSISFKKFSEIVSGQITSFLLEKRYLHKDGHFIWTRIIVSLIKDKDNNPLYQFVEIEDISTLKQYINDLEEAKEQAEKSNRLKDAFISTISHEVKTPLNGILGLADIILSSKSQMLTFDDKNIYDMMEYSAKRLTHTMDHIVTMSKLKTNNFELNPEVLELSVIFQKITEEYVNIAKQKKLYFEIENHCLNTKVYADRVAISSAFHDLLENAIKFTEKGGIKIILSKQLDKYVLKIKDSGIGMSEEYLSRIFQPYSQEDSSNTRKYEGVGLGLSIAKLLLEQNGATLSIESVKNVGTTVIIEFPECNF